MGVVLVTHYRYCSWTGLIKPSMQHFQFCAILGIFVSPENLTCRDVFHQRRWWRRRPDFLVQSITLSQIIPDLVCMCQATHLFQCNMSSFLRILFLPVFVERWRNQGQQKIRSVSVVTQVALLYLTLVKHTKEREQKVKVIIIHITLQGKLFCILGYF